MPINIGDIGHVIEHNKIANDLLNKANSADLDATTAGFVSAAGTTATKTALIARQAHVNVRDYGAKGDGIANDTAAIQAAINAVGPGSFGALGGTVYFPAGIYLAQGLVLADNVDLTGAGRRATRIQGTGATTILTLGTQGNNVSNLAFRGTSAAGSVGIQTNAIDSHHWNVTDCFISGLETGISITQSYIIAITRVTIQACTVGIKTYGANVNILSILHGEIQGCVDGVRLEATSKQINFTAATIEGNTGYGILQAGSSFSITVTDCYFESNDLGNFYQTGQGRGVVFSGCVFESRGAYGVYLAAGLDVTIQACTFRLIDVGAVAIRVLAAVARVTIARNWYALGYEFVPATHFSGTELLQLDRQIVLPRLTSMPPAAQFFASSGSGGPSVNFPHGTAPTTPVNGDIWTTTAGLFVRINGVTRTVTVT